MNKNTNSKNKMFFKIKNRTVSVNTALNFIIAKINK